METNTIVSYNEMHGSYYELQAVLSATNQTLSLHFLVGWSHFCGFIFMIILESMKLSHQIFNASIGPFILIATKFTNLQNPHCAADADFCAVQQLVTIPGLLNSIRMQDWIKRNSLHQ
jgi:hypothetical protein